MSEAPAWFVKWSVAFANECKLERERTVESTAKMLDIVEKLVDRVKNLEARVTAIESSKQPDISEIRNEISALSQNAEIEDNCEVLISDVPYSSDLELPAVAEKTLAALGLSTFTPHVVNTRKWTVKLPSKRLRPSPGPTTNTTSIVVEFSGPHVRDKVLRSSRLLRNANCRNASRDGCPNNPSIRPLWPKPVYNLWRKAVGCYSNLNYARPIVRNLSVFMRETCDSPLIRINSLEELDRLQARPNRTT